MPRARIVLALVALLTAAGAVCPLAADAQPSPDRAMSVLPHATTTVLLVISAGPGISGRAADALPLAADPDRRTRLARGLGQADAAAVISTDTRDAVSLARLLADSVLHTEWVPYDRGADAPDRFAGWLTANLMLGREGHTVVLVAERPLAAAIVRRLTGVVVDAASPSSHDELFAVTVAPGGAGFVRAGL